MDVELPAHRRRHADDEVRDLVARLHDWNACQRMQLRRPATMSYNCHGMTFANRRTNIRQPETVQQVLAEDGYRPVHEGDAKPGDIVVYYRGDEIIHTGLLVGFDVTKHGRVPYVLSKFGALGEYVHPADVLAERHDHLQYHREGHG